jgi:hypothetical protein
VSCLDGAQCGFGQRFDVHEPLVGEQRLEDRLSAIAARHHELVRLDAFDQSQRRKIGHDSGARGESIEASVGYGNSLVERGCGRHDIDDGQAVALTDFIIVEIVRGGDLDAAAAEGGIDVGVADDGDFARGQRQPQATADQVTVALVIGVHRHRRIAQHGFRPRRRNHQVSVAADQGIAQVPEAAHFLFGDHLQVR